MYRPFTLFGTQTAKDSEEWSWVVGDRKLHNAVFCEFGLAEEVVGLLVFEDETAEVGIGESMRPYHKVMTGTVEEASHEFFKTVIHLAIGKEFADLFHAFAAEQVMIEQQLIEAHQP